MEKARIAYLHNRFVEGKISQAELVEWKMAIDDISNEDELLSLIEKSWNNIPEALLSDIDTEKAGQILEQIVVKPQRKAKNQKLWIKLAAAASLLVAVSSIAIWFNSKQSENAVETSSRTDIGPGKLGGTLTLGSGKKIKLADLSNINLSEEFGVKISKNAKGQLVYQLIDQSEESGTNVLSTGYGETQEVVLPDGSVIWLNAASSLTYHSRIKHDGVRKVSLKGEAYFEIAKDKTAPFIVETETQQIQVLGTHFNINSYADETSAKTTLVEGSIRLNTIYGQQKILKPGQQAVLSNKSIALKLDQTELAIAWKNNKFMFESASIEEVMRMVTRWYNVEVIYDGDLPKSRFGGSVSKFENVSKVLEILESTKKVHFEIKGRRILVRK